MISSWLRGQSSHGKNDVQPGNGEKKGFLQRFGLSSSNRSEQIRSGHKICQHVISRQTGAQSPGAIRHATSHLWYHVQASYNNIHACLWKWRLRHRDLLYSSWCSPAFPWPSQNDSLLEVSHAAYSCANQALRPCWHACASIDLVNTNVNGNEQVLTTAALQCNFMRTWKQSRSLSWKCIKVHSYTLYGLGREQAFFALKALATKQNRWMSAVLNYESRHPSGKCIRTGLS